MDEKLDSRQLDSSEQQMKNAMETPKRKRGTKRVITLEDLKPLFGQKREDAAKILGVSVSTFKRHCRRNGITWWNGNDCSRSLELVSKHRETPGEKTTPSCKTPSIRGRAETGNQVLDSSIVEIEGNLQEQDSFQTENVSKEGCYLEEKRSVEIINPYMDEKLDSRQLDSSEQQMKNAMETPERKCGTKRVITLEDLQPLFGHRKREDAAKILGVSESTLKRHCRRNGITWWNGNDCSRSLQLVPKHRETTGEKKTPSCKTPSITGQTETGNQVLDNSIVEIEGKLQEQDSFQTENFLKEVAAAVSEGDSKSSWPMLPCSDPTPKQSVVTIKATYGEDIVKFDLSSTPGIVELKEEMAKRLELESESFKVKYQDEDQEWILMACDADFQRCLKFSSSLGNPLIRLLVVDKGSNFRKSRKRCRRR